VADTRAQDLENFAERLAFAAGFDIGRVGADGVGM